MCKAIYKQTQKHQSLPNFVSILVYFNSPSPSFSFSSSSSSSSSSSFTSYSSMATSSTLKSDNIIITVEKNPSDARLSELGIKSWPKWGCPPGKFPLKFDAQETCYLLKGKVKAYTKGTSDCVEFGAGDLVTIPKGLSCTWDVSIAVDKHYKFDSSSSSSTT